MTAEFENLYSGDDKAVAELYARIFDGKSVSQEAASILICNQYITVDEKCQLLYTLAQKFPAKYTDLWLKFMANNVFLLRKANVAHSLHSYLYHQNRQSELMSDENIVKLWRFLAYLIGQGVAEYYPYMRHITARHGEVTTYTDSDLKIISYYSAVFGFDGYNEQSIKSILQRAPMSSEQTLPIFRQLKIKREKAYSNYALALLHIMKRAFAEKKFKRDRFETLLLDIPKKYQGDLYVAPLLRNGERLYANLRRFYKAGGANSVYFMDDRSYD